MLFAKKKSAQTKSGRHNQSQSSEGGGGEKEEEKKTKHAIKQEGGIEGKEGAAMTLMEKELLQRWAQKATFLKLFCLVLLANRQEG